MIGMTAERFGLDPEVAAYSNAEELREAIDALQALIALLLLLRLCCIILLLADLW